MTKKKNDASQVISQISLTEEQKSVINTVDKNLLVSASAGSGKTMVMIRRIVEMIISKKASIADMLVVTFTKAAASEMKLKLIDALNSVVPKTDYIRSELIEINVANISTLHSFCARLLKTYFYEIGLDPSFVLIDEVESRTLKDKAIEKLIYDCFISANKDFFELLDIFSLKRSDENFREVIFKIADYMTTQVNTDSWIFNTLSGSFDDNLNNNLCTRYINNYVSNMARKDFIKLEALKQKCISLGSKDLAAYLDEFSRPIANIKGSNTFIENSRLIKLRNSQIKIPQVSLEYGELKEEVKELRDKIKNNLDKYNEIFGFDDEKVTIEKMKVVKKRVTALFKLVQDYLSIYNELKKEKVALDFSDLEKYTIDLLKNEEVKKVINERFKYVFVDEYQDINMVQEEILKNVSRKNNLFMVGDIKQSIYRFRASEPQIFVDKYNSYSDSHSILNKAINLNHNFRSHQDILTFVNEVFLRTMTKEFGDLDYSKGAMLKKGDANYPNVNEFPIVKLVSIVSPENKSNENEQVLPLYSVKNHINPATVQLKNAMAEGKAVVEAIKKLINTDIYIAGKTPNTKRVEYNDIAILTAQRNEYLIRILNELDAEEIPFSTDIEVDIFEEPILNVLKSLLQIIDNRNQDVPLLSVMQSELFNFSVDELAEIRRNDSTSKFYFQAVKNACKSVDIAQRLRKKCISLFESLDNFTFLSKVLPVDQLISKIITSFDFNYLVANVPNGAKALSNLNKLLSFLPSKSYNFNLTKFLNYINDNPIKFEVESSENSVRVTTIHKSKGLQYPIVILVGCGRDLLINRGPDLTISKNMGIAINSYDIDDKTKSTNLIKNACLLERKRLEIEEKSRLLYVALTRAINHLIMIGTQKEKSINKITDPSEAKSFFDWLMPVVEAKSLNQLIDNKMSFNVEIRSLNSFNVAESQKTSRNLVFGKTDEKVSIKTEKVFNYKYPFTMLVDMPTKMTVTEILHTAENTENVAQIFENSSKNGALIGSVYHKFLEQLNFACDNFNDEFQRVISEFTDEESKLIKKSDIQKFLDNKMTKHFSTNTLYKEKEFIALTKIETKGKKTDDKDGMIVQGIVDLIVDLDDGLVVVDYKTNKWNDENLFVKNYGKQVDIYSKVVEESYQKKVVGKYIYSFSLAKYIQIK